MYANDTVILLGLKKGEHGMAAYTAVNVAVQYCHGNDLVVHEEKLHN